MTKSNPANPGAAKHANRAARLLLAVGIVLLPLILAPATPAVAQTNPVPLVNQPLVPSVVQPGSASFTLTVSGTGFVSGSIVQWNGSVLATGFVSASRLTATVPASDVLAAETARITVSSPAPGGGVSNSELLSVTNPRSAIALGSVTGTGVGDYPYEALLAVADFNGDGKPDLAVPNLTLPGTVSILLGNGDGTLKSPTNYPSGPSPYCVAVADLNNDGKADLVVTDIDDDTVSVLLGNGDGTFGSYSEYAVGTIGETPGSLVTADFNGDGHLDLAVGNSFDGSISILLGNGDGTFQPQLVTPSYGGGALAVGDFNADGKLDLAVATGRVVTILLGNGDGTFSEGSVINASADGEVASADVNSDGILDLVWAAGYTSIDVALGRGDGTFQTPTTYTVPSSPSSIVIADFNGDGKLDVAVAGVEVVTYSNNGPYVLATLLGNGDGTFQTPIEVPTAGQIFSLAAADFNGDGMMDLGTIDGSLATVYLGTTAAFSAYIVNFGNQGAGTTSPAQTVTLTNNGASAMSISGVAATSYFGQTNNCGTSLAAGASCTLNVTFTPATYGNVAGDLTIYDSALGSPQTLLLAGTGEAPGVSLSPTSISFGTQVIGTSSASQSVRLTNTGNASLTISSVQASAGFVKSGGCPATVVAGASCTIKVSFLPEHTGALTGTLTITDNAAGSPQKVTLSGTGTAAQLSATSLYFGNVPVHTTSAAQTLTLTNAGKAAFNILSVKIAGSESPAFAQSNNCPVSLAAAASCTVTVTFTPPYAQYFSATLQISDTAGGSPQAVALSGYGAK